MTREEAINELKEKIKSAKYIDSNYVDNVSINTLKIAISALNALETNVEDTISRQAAIDAPKKFTRDCNPDHFVGHSNFIDYMDSIGIWSFGEWQFANGFNLGLKAAEVAIEELPSTERAGRWLDTYNDGDWHCSECGAIVEKDEQDRHYWQRCYHCGARMVDDYGRYN